jgi:superfamily II DNA/RNA helicase
VYAGFFFLSTTWVTPQFSNQVATDVAARGLHIAGVEHVINYDFPLNVQVRPA